MELDLDLLRREMEADPYQTTRELTVALGHYMDYRADTALSLLTLKRTHTWLERIATGDEKWISYSNIHRRAQWVGKGTDADVPKINVHVKKRLKLGNKNLEDGPCSGRPTAISFDELKNLAEQHPYEGVRYFAASLGCSLSTVSKGLRSLAIVKKLGQWLPHALSGGNTGDQKWVLYLSHTHKRAWCAGDEMPDLL
ncbi:hypothetical protein RB195_002064 [Necator americanus]|uniref:Transposase n=1 Tax=Necator americanus TaxID=51031 RepID=A0ABR1DI92_NECAM